MKIIYNTLIYLACWKEKEIERNSFIESVL